MAVELGRNYEGRLSSLQMRGHRVGYISDIVRMYPEPLSRNGDEKRIPIELLYAFPQPAEMFLDAIVQEETERYYFFYEHVNGELRKTAVEQLGLNLQGVEQFKLQTLEALRRVFLSDPQTPVYINTQPDDFCFACQSTEEDRPGVHCASLKKGIDRKAIRALEKTIIDFTKSRVVLDDTTVGNIDELPIEISDDEIILPVSLLRSKKFQRRYKKNRENNHKLLHRSLVTPPPYFV